MYIYIYMYGELMSIHNSHYNIISLILIMNMCSKVIIPIMEY